MSTRKATPTRATVPQEAYQPPQPMFALCPTCGCLAQGTLVQRGPGEKPVWREPPVTPVRGDPHDCEDALALNAIAQGTRWPVAVPVASQVTRVALGRATRVDKH